MTQETDSGNEVIIPEDGGTWKIESQEDSPMYPNEQIISIEFFAPEDFMSLTEDVTSTQNFLDFINNDLVILFTGITTDAVTTFVVKSAVKGFGIGLAYSLAYLELSFANSLVEKDYMNCLAKCNELQSAGYNVMIVRTESIYFDYDNPYGTLSPYVDYDVVINGVWTPPEGVYGSFE